MCGVVMIRCVDVVVFIEVFSLRFVFGFGLNIALWGGLDSGSNIVVWLYALLRTTSLVRTGEFILDAAGSEKLGFNLFVLMFISEISLASSPDIYGCRVGLVV